jgi:hypothetical protein
LLEQKSSLAETNWVKLTTTTNLGAIVPSTGGTGFFRVSDQAKAANP